MLLELLKFLLLLDQKYITKGKIQMEYNNLYKYVYDNFEYFTEDFQEKSMQLFSGELYQ
jgi:hypothetical protein